MNKREKKEVLAIIPIRGDQYTIHNDVPIRIGKHPILHFAIAAARQAKLITRTMVSTENKLLMDIAQKEGAECPFIRPLELTAKNVPQLQVLIHCLDYLKRKEDYTPHYVLLLEAAHPLRLKGMLDKIIEVAFENSLDSAFPAFEENGNYWYLSQDNIPCRIFLPGTDELTTKAQRKPFYREINGLGLLTKPEILRSGRLLGDSVGMIPIRDISGIVDLDEPHGLILANSIMNTPSLGKEFIL